MMPSIREKRVRAILLAAFGLGLAAGSVVIAAAVRETPAALVLLAIAAIAGVIVVVALPLPWFVNYLLAFATGQRQSAAFDGDTIDGDLARIGDLEQVEAAEEGAFTATAGADEHNGFAGLLLMVDAMQHTVRVIGFNEVLNGDHTATFFPTD